MINRRSLLIGATALVAASPVLAADPIVHKGIRFLGKYPKEVYLQESEELFNIFVTYWKPDRFTPAPLSMYREIIERQRKLGFLSWEMIS